MAVFIAKQPNGPFCGFSTVVDTVTDYNMAEQEYIEQCKQEAEDMARMMLQKNIWPFEIVEQLFVPNCMSEEAFNDLVETMSRPSKFDDETCQEGGKGVESISRLRRIAGSLQGISGKRA